MLQFKLSFEDGGGKVTKYKYFNGLQIEFIK